MEREEGRAGLSLGGEGGGGGEDRAEPGETWREVSSVLTLQGPGRKSEWEREAETVASSKREKVLDER